MGGNSGYDNSQSDAFKAQDDQLTQTQDFMRRQSMNTLNREMVRTQADFGFGKRPEPTDLPVETKLVPLD